GHLLFVVNLTNDDVYQAGQIVLPRGVLHITRTKLLRRGTCYENLTFINYGLSPVEVKFSMEFGADFADVFEVRGMTRQRKGVRHDRKLKADQVCFVYEGLDNVLRRTRIQCSPAPDTLNASVATFISRLEPKQEKEFSLTYYCVMNDAMSASLRFSRSHMEETVVLKRFIPVHRLLHYYHDQTLLS